jgi:hypothetical protein
MLRKLETLSIIASNLSALRLYVRRHVQQPQHIIWDLRDPSSRPLDFGCNKPIQ